MPTMNIWISYDLGLKGDYEGLYAWLDNHHAKECVNSLVVLSFQYERSLTDELKEELKNNLTTDKRTRIYVVYRDNASGRNKGTFIFGGRRAGAWTGYASRGIGTTDEEEE